MKQDLELKLQACLDGELSPEEAREVAALVDADADARALRDELQMTRAMLQGNEPEMRLPESREFFWGKIEREIQRLEDQPAAPSAPWWLAFMRRHIAAVSGVGVATALLLVGAFQMNWVAPDLLEEIDNPMDDNTISFRSESQKMTVVWISDASEAPAEDDSEPTDEPIQ